MTSISSFRARIRALLDENSRRNLIVLAVDGIPYELARSAWSRARVTRVRSVFPSTSATAWTSSLSGASVDDHGIPGVVFEADDGSLIDVYRYRGALGEPPENLFGDARERGYTPVAIVGDLEDTHCTWRDQLVYGARAVTGHTFYARGELGPSELAERIVAAIEHALATHDTPCLVWCFVDADLRIHRYGYDAEIVALLERVDAIAAGWSHDAIVIAHSDHGLVPTRHDPRVANALEPYRMGGAGRTRWLYVEPAAEQRVRDELARGLPPSVRVRHADELFAPSSRARRRVGSIVVIAEGEDFLAADGYRFEHGSLSDGEMYAAFAEWRA
jgi:hypothetical protein